MYTKLKNFLQTVYEIPDNVYKLTNYLNKLLDGVLKSLKTRYYERTISFESCFQLNKQNFHKILTLHKTNNNKLQSTEIYIHHFIYTHT